MPYGIRGGHLRPLSSAFTCDGHVLTGTPQVMQPLYLHSGFCRNMRLRGGLRLTRRAFFVSNLLPEARYLERQSTKNCTTGRSIRACDVPIRGAGARARRARAVRRRVAATQPATAP